jgi:CBS domain containing-hemolysin-like protein
VRLTTLQLFAPLFSSTNISRARAHVHKEDLIDFEFSSPQLGRENLKIKILFVSLVVLSHVLAHLAYLLLLLVDLFLVLAHLAPLLLLLVVLSLVLARLAPLLLLLIVLSLVLARLTPLLLLLVVLTHGLAQLGLCVHCVFAQCQMIAPTSSLQDWHAFVLDKEP